MRKYRRRRDARAYFGGEHPISNTTFWRWEKAGFIKGIKIGGLKFYAEDELESLAERLRQQRDSEAA
jgi:hypothetical protein